MSKAKIREVNELGTLVKIGSGIALAILLIPVFIVSFSDYYCRAHKISFNNQNSTINTRYIIRI